MPGPGRARRSPRGFTLIETLLAVAVFALVAGVFLSVYYTISSAVQRQNEWRDAWRPAAAALDVLRRDAACAVNPGRLDAPAFVLEDKGLTSDGGASALSFYTAVFVPEADGERGIGIQAVSYRAQHAGNGPDVPLALVCERRFITGPAAAEPAVLDRLAGNIVQFRAEVWFGNDWITRWPKDGAGPLPGAVRLKIVVREGKGTRTLETETLIHAGQNPGPATGRAQATTS